MKTKDSFFEDVYEIVKLIPKGRVTSYGAIARYLGTTKSARVVGWALNNIHLQKDYIPAHRVVNSVGLLTGKFHFDREYSMEKLLLNEGIEVINNKIVNFELLFWDPSKEINM